MAAKKRAAKRGNKTQAARKAKRGKSAPKKALATSKSASTKGASSVRAASSKPVAKKLQLKAPMRVRVVAGPEERLGVLPMGVTATDGAADAVVLFAADAGALASHLDDALSSLTGAGLLWVCYPKGGGALKSDLNRDILVRKLDPHGLRPVALVAVDATWSAMRFRAKG